MGRRSKKEGKMGPSSNISSRLSDYNDPTWWLQYPELAKNAGNVWFSDPTGKYIPAQTLFNTRNLIKTGLPTAGIMAIKFVPTYGVTGKVTGTGYVNWNKSAVQIAANHLYWDIVHANSRNISYTQDNLMQLLIAMDNVYMMITDAVRTYGLVRQYSVTNRYICQALVRACNWDYDNVVSNLAQFRYTINRLIMLVNRIHIPRVYNIFAEHASSFTRIFADQEDVKAQFYVMYTDGYYVYSDSEGKLEWTEYYASTTNAFRTKGMHYLSVIEDRIMEILNSEYMGVMDGDILKRFGEESMFRMPEIPEDMSTPIVKDGEFLLKLLSATFTGGSPYVGTSGIREPSVRYTITHGSDSISELEITGSVRQHPANSARSADAIVPTALSAADSWIVNFDESVPPTPENIMLATRYVTLLDAASFWDSYAGTTMNYAAVKSVGTEMLVGYTFWFIDANGNLDHTELECGCYPGAGLSLANFDNMKAIISQALMAQFKYRPQYFLRFDLSDNGNVFRFVTPCAAIDNYSVFDPEYIDRLNYVAVVSIFERVDGQQYGFAHV